MTRGRLAGRIVFVLGAAIAFHACGHDPASNADPISVKLSRPQEVPPLRPALRAWVDPATGRLAAPPAADDVALAGRGTAAAEATDLVLVPGRTRAGGRMVDLRGRFEFTLRASVSADGRLGASCDASDDLGGRE